MQILTNNDYKLFCSLAQVSQTSLRKTLLSFIKQKYSRIYATKDYIYAIGDIPIALVAHMDTVFPKPPREIYYDREKSIMWSPTGLGADDRAGIFSIIKILQDGYKPTLLFCADEEKGALGAEQLVKDHPQPKEELRFLIELDRCGTNDCVFYDCGNDGFVKYIENFGFIEDWGTFSDISEICPAWGIAGVNLSVGYDREHTTSETLKTSALLSTIKKVEQILNQTDWPFFKYIHRPYVWKYGYGWNYGPTEYDDLYYDNLGTAMWDADCHVCDNCGLALHDYELIPAKDEDGNIHYYCPDCCGDFVEWCYGCGEAYIKGVITNSGYCPDCVSKGRGQKKNKKKKGK